MFKTLLNAGFLCAGLAVVGLFSYFNRAGDSDISDREDKALVKQEQSQLSEHKPSKEKSAEYSKYSSDLERLNILSERVNRVLRANYVVVLGSSQTATGGCINIDYSLFDKLTDDAAAVLIAEAIEKSKAGAADNLNPLNQNQSNNNLDKRILQIDETAGRTVAAAGFGSDGFTQWLESKEIFDLSYENRVSNSQRLAAFMRGYILAKKQDK